MSGPPLVRARRASRRRASWRAALVLIGIAAPAPAQDAPVDPLTFDRSIQPLLGQYCYRCHGDQKTKGDVDLQRDENPLMIADHHRTWSTVLKMLRAGEMPPEKAKQPSREERDRLIAFVDRTINVIDCAQAKEPGRPAFRRLNRVEYDNTIRALFHLDIAPARSFAPDGSSYGFDNISDALSISPLQVEQYFQAADQVLDAVFKDRKALSALDLHPPGPGMDARASAREAIGRFARRAFRKPADADTVDRLLAIYEVAMKQKGSYLDRHARRAQGDAGQSALPHPHRGRRCACHGAIRGGRRRPGLLSGLSFHFLWSGAAHDEPAAPADEKWPHEPAVLEQQVHRLDGDPRSAALAGEPSSATRCSLSASFADHYPDAQALLAFTSSSMQQRMLDEAYLFLAEMVHADRPPG